MTIDFTALLRNEFRCWASEAGWTVTDQGPVVRYQRGSEDPALALRTTGPGVPESVRAAAGLNVVVSPNCVELTRGGVFAREIHIGTSGVLNLLNMPTESLMALLPTGLEDLVLSGRIRRRAQRSYRASHSVIARVPNVDCVEQRSASRRGRLKRIAGLTVANGWLDISLQARGRATHFSAQRDGLTFRYSIIRGVCASLELNEAPGQSRRILPSDCEDLLVVPSEFLKQLLQSSRVKSEDLNDFLSSESVR